MRKLILTLITLIFLISCNNYYKLASVKLTKNERKDSVLEVYKLKNRTLFDLKFCIEKYKYPPILSRDIFWTRPDTLGFSSIEKGNIKYKYDFDKDRKVTMYFYQGSWVSGIFPCTLR